MHGDRRDPLGARLILVDHGLFLEVVLKHSLMCGDKEVGLSRMELHGLHDTLSLCERSLRGRLGQRVDHNLDRGLKIMCHRREVVSLRVPDDALNNILEGDLDHFATVSVLREGPLPELLLLIVEEDILIVVLLSL